MLMIITSRNYISKSANERFWIVKCVVLLVLFIVALCLGAGFYRIVTEIAKFLAVIFIFFEIIIVIDLLYTWGEKWIKIYDDGAKLWGLVIILVMLGMYALTIFLSAKNFDWFYSGHEGCRKQLYIIIFSLILMVICTGMTLTRMNS